MSIELIAGNTLNPEKIYWLWKGWLPRGKLVILAGQPGTGKTTVMLSIAAIITSGGSFPDMAAAEVGDVVIWSGEDGITDTLLPRLIAMGANASKVHFLEGKEGAAFDPSKDIGELTAELESFPNVKLIIIDPVVSAIKGDSHKNTEVRQGLQPLVELGRQTGACIVGISHFNKVGAIRKDPIDLVSGSLAFTAVARVVLGAAKLPAPDEHGYSRIFCRIKSNIGPDEDGIGYNLDLITLPENSDIEASIVTWGQQIIGHSRDLLTIVPSDDTEDRSAISKAQDFLQEILACGPVAAKIVEEKAVIAGHSNRTIRRAKEVLKIACHKQPGKCGQWLWELPKNIDE